MENLKIFILSVVFLIVSSCRGLKRINALSLNSGSSWEVSSLIEQGLELDQFYGAVPSLDFLGGRKLAEFSGYNNFSGDFSRKYLG
jgi:hypothetical protein